MSIHVQGHKSDFVHTVIGRNQSSGLRTTHYCLDGLLMVCCMHHADLYKKAL